MKQPIKIFLIILIVALIFGGVLWGKSALEDIRSVFHDEDVPALVPTETIADDSITIMVTGNLLCDGRYQSRVKDESGIYRFSDTLTYLKPLFAKADLVIGNLETCVSKSYPLSIKKRKNKDYANAPAAYLEALKNAGVNGLMLSGEHNCDLGKKGIEETLEAVRSRGFMHTGLYDSRKDRHFCMYEANGIKVAFLSFTDEFGDNIDKLDYDDQQYMLSSLDVGRVAEDIGDARKAGADYVMVFYNKGSKYSTKTDGSDREIMELMAEAGADYVFGSQSYVVRKRGSIKRDGGSVHCQYGMGNLTGSASDKRRETVLIRITLKRMDDGQVKISKRKYIPCYMTKNWNDKHMVVVPEGVKCRSAKTRETLDGHYAHIRSVLGLKDK